MMFSQLVKKWTLFEKRILKNKTPFQKKLWDAFVFLVRFNILAIPFYVLLIYPWNPYPVQAFIADKIVRMLSFVGTNVSLYDPITFYLKDYNWYVQIIKDCIGWKSSLALFGLMFAVRNVKLAARIKGLLVGVPLLFLLNIFRIFSSIYLTTIFGIQNFRFIHDFLWQWGLIVAVLGIWVYWLNSNKLVAFRFKTH